MIAALARWLIFVGVDVAGDGTCPAPSDVARRLAEVTGAHDDAGTSRARPRARVSRSGGAVHVELLTAGGERIAKRDLAADAGCGDLAEAVAVVIATWEAELDPRLTARVSLPAPPVRAAGEPVLTRTPPPPRPSPPNFDLGLALFASLAGGQVVPGARIGAWVAPAGWHLGLGATVSGVTSRSEPVGSFAGAARWSRVAFGAGPEGRFTLGATTVALHAQGLVGVLQVEGVGLPTTASDASAQFGTGAGLHLGRPWGNATPWIGADLLFWPGRDRLEIAGLSARGELPRLEIQLAVGLSLGRFP